MKLQTFRFDMDFYREFDFRGSSILLGASITAAELEGEFDSRAPSRTPAAAWGCLSKAAIC